MKLETSIKLIQAFESNPLRAHNINQLSKISDISLATTYRTLNKMKDSGMLSMETNGNEKLYDLNLKNAITRKILEAISISKRREFFEKNPEYVYLLSRMKEKLREEIDLILLNPEKEDIQIYSLYDGPFMQKNVKLNGYKISVSFLTKEKLRNQIKTKNFIVLYGESKFWHLISELKNKNQNKNKDQNKDQKLKIGN